MGQGRRVRCWCLAHEGVVVCFSSVSSAAWGAGER